MRLPSVDLDLRCDGAGAVWGWDAWRESHDGDDALAEIIWNSMISKRGFEWFRRGGLVSQRWPSEMFVDSVAEEEESRDKPICEDKANAKAATSRRTCTRRSSPKTRAKKKAKRRST